MALTARRRPIFSQSWSSEHRRHPHRHFHCFFGRPSTFLPADTEGILSRSLPIILYKYAGGHPSPIRCFPPQHSTGGYCYWHRPRRRRWSYTSQIAGQTTSHNCARSMPPFEWSASLNEMAWIGIHTRKSVSQSVNSWSQVGRISPRHPLHRHSPPFSPSGAKLPTNSRRENSMPNTSLRCSSTGSSSAGPCDVWRSCCWPIAAAFEYVLENRVFPFRSNMWRLWTTI